MARQITSSPGTPAALMRLELAVFASGDRNVDRKTLHPLADGDESQNIPYINALCQTFQDKLIEYYNAGTDAKDRLERLCEIGQMFRETSFTKNGQMFGVASASAHKTAQEAYEIGADACPPGTQCVDRTCVGAGGKNG